MPPQPLSKVRHDATVNVLASNITSYPDLALLVMTVIDTWSRIDVELAIMLTAFLKADFIVVTAMLQALTGGEGRRAALLGAANQALSGDDLKLFNAVMKVIAPSRNRRNEFAHHIWNHSPEVPDALILIDPKHLVRDEALRCAHVVKLASAGQPIPPDPFAALPLSDNSNAFVYRRKDLEEEKRLARDCYQLVYTLQLVMILGDRAGLLRTSLLQAPQVQQALQQMTSGSAP